MDLKLKPKPLAPFLRMIGGFRLRVKGDVSLLGDPSLELVLDPPGDVAFGVVNSSKIQNS